MLTSGDQRRETNGNMRYNHKHISPNLSSWYGYEGGMETGWKTMSYGRAEK